MSEAIPGMQEAPPPAEPKDAAVVVLVRMGPRGLETFWLRRERTVSLAAGFYALPRRRVGAGECARRLRRRGLLRLPGGPRGGGRCGGPCGGRRASRLPAGGSRGARAVRGD